jgi:hypothetical protein
MNPYISLPKVPIVIGRQDFVVSRCRGKKCCILVVWIAVPYTRDFCEEN